MYALSFGAAQQAYQPTSLPTAADTSGKRLLGSLIPMSYYFEHTIWRSKKAYRTGFFAIVCSHSHRMVHKRESFVLKRMKSKVTCRTATCGVNYASLELFFSGDVFGNAYLGIFVDPTSSL